MAKAIQVVYAGSVIVKDPETGGEVELEIMKDPTSGGMMGIDASFLEQVSDSFNSPYNRMRLRAPETASGGRRS